jgi:hypothetical protein
MKMQPPEFPRYPSINLTGLEVLVLRMLRRRKSFRRDATRLTGRMSPPVRYLGLEYIPASGPYLLLANHYARPGFSTAWIALVLSAVQPAEVTWVVVDEWVFEDSRLRFLLVPAMGFFLTSIRRVYGFLPMPTMLRGHSDMPARAAAVRKVLRYCRSHPEAVIGLTPEGWDSPPHGVKLSPPGAGRFILRLNRMHMPILPAAIAEKDGCLVVKFGPQFNLTEEHGVSQSQIDETVRSLIRERLLRLYQSIA